MKLNIAYRQYNYIFEDNTDYRYDSWNDFLNNEPWIDNTNLFEIPVAWSARLESDSNYDEEIDTPSIVLVYLKPYPLEANSIYITLDSNEDMDIIHQWLINHGFIVLGG
jgi:hypothetical protein